MTDGRDMNDVLPFGNSQLEVEDDPLDAILFDPSFAGASEDLMTGGNSGSANDEMDQPCNADDHNREPSPLMAFHESDALQFPSPALPFANTTITTIARNKNTNFVDEKSRQSTSTNCIGGNNIFNQINNTQQHDLSTNDSKGGTTITRDFLRPQLFGKELSFTVPAPRPGENMATSKPYGSSSTTIGAASVATATNTNASPTTAKAAGKRKRAPPPVSSASPASLNFASSAISEDESERERRRQDRNYREQQRSQQISNQIVVLRSLLEEANLQCKSDKYSTLATVVDYVKQLQSQSSMLDQQHKKLLDTIRQTTEIMSSQYMSVQANHPEGGSTMSSSQGNVIGAESSTRTDNDQVYVQGLDYRAVFRASPFALATTSIDGRFLDVSEGFEAVTKFKRDELLPLEKHQKRNIDKSASTADPAITGTISNGPDDASSTTSDISSLNGGGSTSAGGGAAENPSHPYPNAPKNLSLFNVLFPSDMSPVYHAMFDILQQPTNHVALMENTGVDEEDQPNRDSWSKHVRLCRNKEAEVELFLNLVRTTQQMPRFFNCTLVAEKESMDTKPHAEQAVG